MATQRAIKATTQEHLDIYTIKDHMVILKDGSTALVLQVSAINFGLLSEDEQDALIFSYASLLNSLSFPIQILMRSIKKDITAYLELLDDRLEQTVSQKLKEQIIKYRSFVRSLVKKNKVLEKKFYIVIPYSYLGMSQVGSSLNPFAKPPQKPPQELDYLLPKARTELYPRRDHLIRQLARLGLQTRQLTTQELVTLFYKTYNPSAEGVEQYLTLPSDYETPAVQTIVNETVAATDKPPLNVPMRPQETNTPPQITVSPTIPTPQPTVLPITPPNPTPVSMPTPIPVSPTSPPITPPPTSIPQVITTNTVPMAPITTNYITTPSPMTPPLPVPQAPVVVQNPTPPLSTTFPAPSSIPVPQTPVLPPQPFSTPVSQVPTSVTL